MARISDTAAPDLFATMEFARDQLRAVGGKDSAAGQREEAARRLESFLYGDMFKELREMREAQRLAARLAAILPADLATGIEKVHPHCPYSRAVVGFTAETESDAMAMLERMPLAPIFNTSRYLSSFMTESEFARQEARKPGSFGELADAAPWYWRVDSYEVKAESFVELDGIPVRVEIKVTRPTMRTTARRVDFKGGFRYEDKRLYNPHNIGTKVRRMYSSDETLAPFVVY